MYFDFLVLLVWVGKMALATLVTMKVIDLLFRALRHRPYDLFFARSEEGLFWNWDASRSTKQHYVLSFSTATAYTDGEDRAPTRRGVVFHFFIWKAVLSWKA